MPFNKSLNIGCIFKIKIFLISNFEYWKNNFNCITLILFHNECTNPFNKWILSFIYDERSTKLYELRIKKNKPIARDTIINLIGFQDFYPKPKLPINFLLNMIIEQVWVCQLHDDLVLNEIAFARGSSFINTNILISRFKSF